MTDPPPGHLFFGTDALMAETEQFKKLIDVACGSSPAVTQIQIHHTLTNNKSMDTVVFGRLFVHVATVQQKIASTLAAEDKSL